MADCILGRGTGIAAVISAYRDGGAIIQKIKVKRAAIRAPPPPRLLEDSIDQAPEVIEKEKQRGIARFGRAFAEGDHIAVIALQQITIQLQGSLLGKLRNATLDDEVVTDFTFLVDAADLGRDQTIATLLELRQRLLQSSAINELQLPYSGPALQPPTVSPTQWHPSNVQSQQVPTRELQPPNSRLSQEPSRSPTISPPLPVIRPKQYKTWTREVSESHGVSGEDDAASGAEDATHAQRKRHGSFLGFFRQHRSQSGVGDQTPKASQSTPPPSIAYSPPAHDNARERQPGAQLQDPQFTYQDWEDDPRQIWGPLESPEAEGQRRANISSVNPSSDSLASPLHAMRTLSIAGAPITPSLTRTHFPRGPIANPTPENNYLGFCKSAWRLQNGDRKAMQKFKEFNDGWSQSNVYFLSCANSKCAFAGQISLDSIWDKVWTVEAQGIRFRWSFLAKSHVTQSKVKNSQYAYQCMICAFQGDPSPVYLGTDTYLDHVQQHRGQPLGEVILYKAKCIADRAADDSEQFDLNLLPFSEQEDVGRRQSNVLSDDLLGLDGSGKNSTEAQDSMFGANEPWNEGLSDFNYHQGGAVERAELE